MQERTHTKGLYRPQDAKESCGFGLIADQQGEASHELLATACTALARMTHRGAVAVDGKTGDGCGVLMQFPESFFRDVARDEGIRLAGRFAVGLVFLNPDPEIAPQSRKMLARHINNETLSVAGWRTVPTDPSVCGEIAKRSLATIEQVFVNVPDGWSATDAERRLFVARRMAAAESVKQITPDPFYYSGSQC